MIRAFGLAMSFATIVLSGACRPSAQQKHEAAVRATAEAEEKASQTMITSGTIDDESIAGEDEALRAKSEAIIAFRNEQAEYRGKLQGEIERLDRRVADARRSKGRASLTRDLEARRDVLVKDLASIDRSTEQDWATLRPRLDRDLASTTETVRPRSDRPWGP